MKYYIALQRMDPVKQNAEYGRLESVIDLPTRNPLDSDAIDVAHKTLKIYNQLKAGTDLYELVAVMRIEWPGKFIQVFPREEASET